MADIRSKPQALWPRTLGAQLKVAASLGLCLALMGAGSIAARQQHSAARAALQTQAANLARVLAAASENAVAADRLDDIEHLLRNAAEFPEVLQVWVTNAKGLSLGHAHRLAGQPAQAVYDPPDTIIPTPSGTQPVLAEEPGTGSLQAWHAVGAADPMGWVRVDFSTAALDAQQRQFFLRMLLTCLVAGAGSVAVMTLLLRKPLRAIARAQRFADGLQHIGGQQIDVIDGPSETQALGRSLNLASARLFELRRQADEGTAALRRHEAALADTNEQLRTIFALSPDALVSIDGQGVVRFANDALGVMTGMRPADITGQPLSVLDAHLRQASGDPAAFESLQTCFDMAQPDLRLTLAHPQHAVLQAMGRLGTSGSASRMLYFRDITRESEIDRMKSEFLSTAAHELRTPMTSIHGCVELLLGRDFDALRSRRMLEIIQRQSNAMVGVINGLLDLSRIEARRSSDFVLESIDLVELVGEVVSDFAPPAHRQSPQTAFVESFCEVPAAHTVRADRQKLAQVLRNLLSNAYKYSSGGAVVVRVLAAQDGAPPGTRRVGLQVQDFGIGMTAEQLARVCERFYRADASGHVLGTGLGMSIVKEIVELLGGHLDLVSEPGRGTTMTAYLPCASEPQAPASETTCRVPLTA